MLIRFTVDNFLSFGNKQELTMIPAEKMKTHSDHVIVNSGVKTLRASAMYGANASGKSNLLKAVSFSKLAVVNKFPHAAHKMFCKTISSGVSTPSTFEFEFVKNGKAYAFGFSILLSEMEVISEWIYEIDPLKDKQVMLFERETKKSRLEIGNSAHLSEEDKFRFETYKSDFINNKTSLFISEMNRNKSIPSSSNLYFFKEIYNWFVNDLHIFRPDRAFSDLGYILLDEKRVNSLIEIFDTGISEILVKEISINEFRDAVHKQVVDDVFDEIELQLERIENAGASVRGRETLFFVLGNKREGIVIKTVSTKHKHSIMEFDFAEESEGTRKLFDLLEILLANKAGQTYLFDEIERSLHPKLTYKFIELFFEWQKENGSQLIFTTHESAIMDQDLLRRDEIWFVERDKSNVSKVYSLDIFKERYDRKLSKAYLEGRYGAIPVFDDFHFKGDE